MMPGSFYVFTHFSCKSNENSIQCDQKLPPLSLTHTVLRYIPMTDHSAKNTLWYLTRGEFNTFALF